MTCLGSFVIATADARGLTTTRRSDILRKNCDKFKRYEIFIMPVANLVRALSIANTSMLILIENNSNVKNKVEIASGASTQISLVELIKW